MNAIVLDIGFAFSGNVQHLSPTVLKHGNRLVLVDCGYAGSLPLIVQSMAGYGLNPDNLSAVIITHHDIDHMGGLYELKVQYPNIKVYASAIEAPYVSGRKKSLRLQQAEDLLPCMPEAQKPAALGFIGLLQSMQTVPVDDVLENVVSELLPGVRVISTPGHMPGHISLYLEESRTLIAADAVVFEDEGLELANPQFTLDLPGAVASVKKLSNLPIEKLVCYHGGVVASGITEKLNRLLGRYAAG